VFSNLHLAKMACQLFVYSTVSSCVPQAPRLCVDHHDSHRGPAIPMPQQLPQLYEARLCVFLSRSVRNTLTI